MAGQWITAERIVIKFHVFSTCRVGTFLLRSVSSRVEM
jgi:hypothetical protein